MTAKRTKESDSLTADQRAFIRELLRENDKVVRTLRVPFDTAYSILVADYGLTASKAAVTRYVKTKLHRQSWGTK